MTEPVVETQARAALPTAAGPRLHVVPAPQSPPRVRRADIQGLRAVAVLLVVAFHSGLLLPGGFTGVDVFFVISGFVITGSLVDELERHGRISFARFYARRVKRLLPALALLLVVVAAVGTLAGPAATERSGGLTGVFASLFAANAYLYTLGTGYFDVSTMLNPLLHTWTLAVEEQIYLVFPLVLVAGWGLKALRSRRATVVVLIVAASAVSFALSLLLSNGTIGMGSRSPVQLAFYSAPTRAWEFGAGAILLLVSPLARRVPALPARILGLIGLGLVGWAALTASHASSPAEAAVLPVVGACAILTMGTATTGGTARLLASRAAVWIGDRSYGWYLWHWPLIVFAVALWPGTGWVTPAAAAAALVPTALSYRFVENPVRHSTRMRGRRVVGLALLCTLVPLAACLGAITVSHGIASLPSMRSWEQSQTLHWDETHGCDGNVPLGQRLGSGCTWSVPRARGRIVVFGDSNAGQLAEPVVRAGNRAGYDVTVTTLSSCPFIGVTTQDANCRQFTGATLSALVRLRPSLVILASRTDAYLAWHHGRAGAASTEAEIAAKSRIWRTALTVTLGRLNRAGIPVVLVHPVPLLPDAPDGCAVLRILTGTCRSSLPRATVELALSNAVSVENSAVATAPRTWALDLDGDLCSATTCSTVRHGVVLYRNSEHLSIQGALALTPSFARAIAAHARGSAR